MNTTPTAAPVPHPGTATIQRDATGTLVVTLDRLVVATATHLPDAIRTLCEHAVRTNTPVHATVHTGQGVNYLAIAADGRVSPSAGPVLAQAPAHATPAPLAPGQADIPATREWVATSLLGPEQTPPPRRGLLKRLLNRA